MKVFSSNVIVNFFINRNGHGRGQYHGSNSIFIVPNRKNILNDGSEKKLIYTPKANYFSIQASDRARFDLSTGKLAEETSTQFFNICNWTNTMVSSVVSKMRSGNPFLNSFSDPNALSDFFTFSKTDVDKNSTDSETIRETNNECGRARVQIDSSNGSTPRTVQMDCEKQQYEVSFYY